MASRQVHRYHTNLYLYKSKSKRPLWLREELLPFTAQGALKESHRRHFVSFFSYFGFSLFK